MAFGFRIAEKRESINLDQTFFSFLQFAFSRQSLRVLHAHEPQVVPDLLQQVVEVPAVVSRDGHTVRHLVDDVELLDGDLIDFVQHIYAGDVDPVVTGN